MGIRINNERDDESKLNQYIVILHGYTLDININLIDLTHSLLIIDDEF